MSSAKVPPLYGGYSGVRILVLPGGIRPERKSSGAGAYDVGARGIASPTQKDPKNPNLRALIFDFKSDAPHFIPGEWEEHCSAIEPTPIDDPNFATSPFRYRLDPGKSVLVDIGFVVEMPPDMLMAIWPRSGLLMPPKRIDISNAPGIVDSDFRGSAGALVENRGTEPFYLYWGIRIAQVTFQRVIFPDLVSGEVSSIEEMSSTDRGEKGFGSTGLHHGVKPDKA